MANLQQKIAEKFLSTLAEQGDLDVEKIAALRQLLERGKKPKAEEFVSVFKRPVGGEVK
ncbi:hypothetical protein [Devosia sp. Root413D1]|uniref:hypothetical protein n=1 Tax=Devosia sp. Root413D1 TaxID=1736531 RepID=UPI000A6C51AF|nr:hypothetical protein [Devosia sp. Root413D1]